MVFWILCIVFWQKTLPCRVTRRYSISVDEWIASSIANQIAVFAIVYEIYEFLLNIYTSSVNCPIRESIHDYLVFKLKYHASSNHRCGWWFITWNYPLWREIRARGKARLLTLAEQEIILTGFSSVSPPY